MASKQGYSTVASSDEASDVPTSVAAKAGENFRVGLAILGFGTCSSLMLIINKLAVTHMPAPSFVLLLQMVSAAAGVKATGAMGYITVDALEWGKVRVFMLVAVGFLACLFANMKTLQYANVETFIVIRSSSPVLIAVLDYLFLGRSWPNFKSAMALLGMVICSIGYLETDSNYQVTAYIWVAIWLCVFAFDQIFIKYAVDNTTFQSNWGRVYYNNFLSAILLSILVMVTQEYQAIDPAVWDTAAAISVSLSCFMSTFISYFAFLCRSLLSATSFTIVGNMCKIVTIIINVLIWDKHASPPGLACLLGCLVCASQYQQAPLRAKEQAQNTTISSAMDVEEEDISASSESEDTKG